MSLRDELEKANQKADPVVDKWVTRLCNWLVDSPYTLPIVIVAAIVIAYLALT